MEEDKKPPAKRSPGRRVDRAGSRELENLDELAAMMSNLSVLDRERDSEFDINLILERLQHLSLDEGDHAFDQAAVDQHGRASNPMPERDHNREYQPLLVDILHVLQ